MREIRILTEQELEQAYKDTFTEAFPPEELKPLSAIRDMIADGIYRALGLFEGSEPLGYIFLWTGDDPYVLIDYLCVPKHARNGGIGAELIRRTVESFPKETVFIGEVEAPTGDAEADGIILRRLGFYDRCGAIVVGYDNALFGVHYKTIIWAQKRPSDEEVMAHHDGFYRRRFSPELYAAAVQIPLREGEQPYRRKEWIE